MNTPKILWKKEKFSVVSSLWSVVDDVFDFNPLPDMPILGSSISAANKDLMSKIWNNGDSLSD